MIGLPAVLWGQNQEDRVYAMLLGSTIGDAAGAPLEFFYPAQRSHWSCKDVPIGPEAISELSSSFSLTPHFRKAGSFAQWQDYAPAGTVTDDTRFKMILIDALKEELRLSPNAFARQILSFEDRFGASRKQLCQSWLDEFGKAAHWQLGERKNGKGLPPERLWGGITSLAGQMALLPVAALFPQDLEATYKKAWELDFIDHGLARDINAALVTGLAEALRPGASWQSIEKAMRTTDPYGYGDSRYGQRALEVWLDFSHQAVARSKGSVKMLFSILESELQAKVWWEAWVPLVVLFSFAEITQYDPLAALQLTLEFGHDTDSYAQLMGAFMGALHGPEIFPIQIREQVEKRLQTDYGQDLKTWTQILTHRHLKTKL